MKVQDITCCHVRKRARARTRKREEEKRERGWEGGRKTQNTELAGACRSGQTLLWVLSVVEGHETAVPTVQSVNVFALATDICMREITMLRLAHVIWTLAILLAAKDAAEVQFCMGIKLRVSNSKPNLNRSAVQMACRGANEVHSSCPSSV